MGHILNPKNQHPMVATILTALDFMAAEHNDYCRLIESKQHAAAFESWNGFESYRKMAQMLLLNIDARNVDADMVRALQLQYDELCTVEKRLAKAHRQQQEWQQSFVRMMQEEDEALRY